MSGTNFPGSIDDNTSLPNPGGTDNTLNTGSPLLGHAYQHDTANAAIKALEAKLGTSISLPGGGYQMLYSTASGASVWGNMPVGGDLTGTLPNPVLIATGVGAGTYGSSTKVPQITVDNKGRITAVSEITITGGGGGGGSSSPLTTKGDIWVFSTVDARLPVGTNGQLLAADNTQATGLKWVPAPTSAVWGSITGTLSDQTDLQSALNAKAPTANPTFSGTLINVQGTTADFYNTVDQTTNFERVRLAWSTNVFQIFTGAAGTGVARDIQIGDTGGALDFAPAAASGAPKFSYNRSSATSGSLFRVTASGGLTGASSASVQYGMKIDPTINQSGTGAYTMLWINPSITGTGSGPQLLIDAQVGGSSKFKVDATGVVTLSTALPVTSGGTGTTTSTGSGSVVLSTSPVITTGTVAADPTTNLGIASKQYVDNLGTTTLVENETPGGLINGSNTAYTTASTYATGSLRVYLNGQRLTSGSGNDYIEATSGFTMQYAPATGDVLTVDYNVTNSHFVQGSNSIIVQETPTGTVNGSTTLFTVLQGKYVANTLEVFVNGLQQTKTTDYTETSPGSGTFTFITAPLTGDVVKVSYQFSTGAGGNADTTDGAHASVDPAAGTIPITDSNNVARVQTYKNLVINGGCQIAQRVTAPSLSTTSQYGAVDRFRVHATGTAVSAGTIAQGSGLSFGATGNSLQVASATITGTGQIFAKHRIESRHAITLKNLAASFACLVNHNVGSNINYVITIRKATAADNFTSVTDISTVTISVPTGTPTIIKLENVALGDVSNGIEIEIRADCGAVTTKTFDYTNFVFAQGAIVQGFAAETFERELRSCQRYYEKSFNYVTAPAINTELKYHNGSAPTGLGGVYCDDFFQVTKRTAATITFWGTASANWEFFDGAWQNGTTSDNVGNDRRIQPFISRSSGTGFNDKFPYIMRGNWTADAEL